MTIPFKVADKVQCRNRIWEVGKIVDNNDGSWEVRLFPEEDGKPQSFLFPHTPIEPVKSSMSRLDEGRLDHYDNYLLLTLATKLSLVYEYDKLMSISSSKMIPERYQLLAVKRVMEALQQRFLIADDVGLGKTIEAGLVMQELTARKRADRVLIVVPAALQDQWKKEMQNHFFRRFYIYNSRKIEGIRELVDENMNPWTARNSIITSIDWVKPQYDGTGSSRKNTNRVFDQLMQVEKSWDMVLIDEAHYVSTDSNRADLAKALQERCDNLMLLTATPHSGNAEHFFNLLNLLDPFMFATPEDLDRADARERVDKVMIRRGKETVFEIDKSGNLVKKFRDRDPHPVEIDFSTEEMKLYRDVSDYTSGGWEALKRKRSVSATERNIGQFLLTLVQKRMVSSLAALRETLARRVESIVDTRASGKLEGMSEKEMKVLLRSYSKGAYLEDEDREMVERYLETRRIQAAYADRTKEVQTLKNLLARADDLIAKGQDAKLRWLTEFIKNLLAKSPTEKVIVFTEYRDTLEYLRENLSKQWCLGDDAVVTIHGGMPLGENEEESRSKLHAEARFQDDETRVLLATDAASEGLNLQKRCHILVNYELPWNPNRLEQRIGRIHRYGQKNIARIYNLMIKGSKEADIFKLLESKIEVIRKQLGSMAEVLGILDRFPLDSIIMNALDQDLSETEASVDTEKELQRLAAMAEELKKTQFLSGCRQFTQADIHEANATIRAAQETIPTHKDVKKFVEVFLSLYGTQYDGRKDGRLLHKTKDKGVFSIPIPPVISDNHTSKRIERATFDREIAARDWSRKDEPQLIAFGHPVLERMVEYCRRTDAAQLGGKVSLLRADYHGIPGILFNFILRFEDKAGRIVREELSPVFVEKDGKIRTDLGRRLYLLDSDRTKPGSKNTIDELRGSADELRNIAAGAVRELYIEYHERVSKTIDEQIRVLSEDMQKFDRITTETLNRKLYEITGAQLKLDIAEDPRKKGQRTRIENQLRVHRHKMDVRKNQIEQMRLGAFPAPELLNLVLVEPLIE